MTFINFINTYNGFFTFIASMGLLVVTIIYTVQTRNQVKKAGESISVIKEQAQDQIDKDSIVKNNYAFLMNDELVTNLLCYLKCHLYIATDLIGINLNLTNDIKFSLQFKPTYNKAKEGVFDHISNNTWVSLNQEMAKYFSNDLMLALTEYYSAITILMKYNQNEISDKGLIEYINKQILTTCKCINSLCKETSSELRKSKYIIDGYTATIDMESGKVNWTKPSK